MAAITWPDVVAIAAELAGVNPTAQAVILGVANGYFNVGMFDGEAGDKTKMARSLFAAHFATLTGMGGSAVAGPMISESIGGLTTTYALLNSQTKFSGSAYADLLNMLIMSSGARIPVVP